MKLIADLHLHSKYSRAVSPQMIISEIAKWAKEKGLGLVGAPDWTHPLFLREVRNDLVEAGEGIYAVKADPRGPKFVLSTEISSIYSQDGKTHRIHNLVLAPSLGIVEKINARLLAQGVNLLSDGRPITGLSSVDLCEIVFSISSDCLIIPAHVWTPWFSLYGSRSGFNSINECFGKYADQIYAIETGLSSDPAMNWRIEELDSRSIASFSDAHSPAKLGREATVFEIDDIRRLRYCDITSAIKEQKIAYTIEFFPEEGKYHFTGHRKCGVVQSPEQTRKLGEACPVCGRPLTVGVMHRVEELAIRSLEEMELKEVIISEGIRGIGWQNRPPYVKLVSLMEILAESLGVGVSSQSVLNGYNKLTNTFGSEFKVLLETPDEKIAKTSGERIAEGIKKVRNGDIVVDPGYDGIFGKVKIWEDNEDRAKSFDSAQDKQMNLF